MFKKKKEEKVQEINLSPIWIDNLLPSSESCHLAREASQRTFDLARNYTTTVFSMQQSQPWLSDGTPASSPWTAAGFLVIRASPSPTLPLSCQCCSWRKADT